MFLTDIILTFCVAVFAIAWTFKATPVRHVLLPATALIGILCGLTSYLAPRGVALPLTAFMGFLLLWVAVAIWRRPDSLLTSSGMRPWSGALILLAGGLLTLPLWIFDARVEFPQPTGVYPVGIRDGEVIDENRGQSWDARSNLRETLLRLWYPASNVSGFTAARRWNRAQAGASRQFFDVLGMSYLSFVSDGLARTVTHAHDRAPPAQGSFPLLIFSHGYLGDAATNAMLMEHLASLGYIVASITHPGESSALIYPAGDHFPLSLRAGETLRQRGSDPDAERAILALVAEGDIQARSDYVDGYSRRAITRERGPIWMDDFRSVMDAVASQSLKPPIDQVLANANLQRVGYLGMSMGALAGPAACHVDARRGAAAALDVGGAMPILRDARARMPVLIFSAGQPARLGGQDFSYEPNSTAGQDPRVHRVTLPGASHWDYTDFALLMRPSWRAWLPPTLFGVDPGIDLIAAQNRLIGDFFDTYLRGEERNFPAAALADHPVAVKDDMAALRAWAR